MAAGVGDERADLVALRPRARQTFWANNVKNVVPTVSSSLIGLRCSGASPYHFEGEDEYELRFIAAKGLRVIGAMPTLESKEG